MGGAGNTMIDECFGDYRDFREKARNEAYSEDVEPYLISSEGIGLLSNIFSRGGIKELREIVERFYPNTHFYAIRANSRLTGKEFGRSVENVSFDPRTANCRFSELEDKLRSPTLIITTPKKLRAYGVNEMNFYKKLSESLEN